MIDEVVNFSPSVPFFIVAFLNTTGCSATREHFMKFVEVRLMGLFFFLLNVQRGFAFGFRERATTKWAFVGFHSVPP